MTRPDAAIAIAALFLAGASWLVNTQMTWFVPTGPELLRNGALRESFDGWQVVTFEGAQATFEDDAAALKTARCPSARNCGVVVEQDVGPPGGKGHFLLSGSAAAEDVRHEGGGDPFSRVMFGSYRDGAADWSVPHEMFGAENSSWNHYSRGFAVDDGVERISVILQVHGTSGVLRVRDLSLTRARWSPSYLAASQVLAGGWVVWLAAAAMPFITAARSRWAPRLALLAASALLVGVMLPGTVHNAVREAATSFVATPANDGAVRLVRKAADTLMEGSHVFLFALLAFGARRAAPDRSTALLVGSLLGFGLVTEMLQTFTLDRSPSLSDFAMDLGGIVIGLFLARLLDRRHR